MTTTTTTTTTTSDQSGYDLSMFESPDMTRYEHGPFVYFYDRSTRGGRTYPFDPEKVHFCPIESRGANHSSIVRLQYRNPATNCLEPLILQTPLMPTMFGLSSMSKADGTDMMPGRSGAPGSGSNGFSGQGGQPGWKIDLSFRDLLQLRYNKDGLSADVRAIELFFLALFKLDMITLKKAAENVKNWFAGNRAVERNPDLLTGLYRACTQTRYSRTKKRYYPPSLRVKASMSRGQFNFKVFDADCRPIKPTDIVSDCQLLSLLEVTGIWFVGDSFGIGLRMLQTQVRCSDVMDNFCLVTPQTTTTTTNGAKEDDEEEDADEEEEDSGADEIAEPAPKKVKLSGMK